MHEHKECEHDDLKHCLKCDVVYCKDCKKEWSKKVWGTLNIPNAVSTPAYPGAIPNSAWYALTCTSTHK